MKTTADKVRELYNKHNPDNLELEIGCEVLLDNRSTNTVRKREWGTEKDCVIDLEDGVWHVSNVEVSLRSSNKILGKHPTVLQVLGMAKHINWDIKVGQSLISILHPEYSEVITVDPNIALFRDLTEETQDKIYQLLA